MFDFDCLGGLALGSGDALGVLSLGGPQGLCVCPTWFSLVWTFLLTGAKEKLS